MGCLALGFSMWNRIRGWPPGCPHSATKSILSQDPNLILPTTYKAISVALLWKVNPVHAAALKKDSQKEYPQWRRMQMPRGEAGESTWRTVPTPCPHVESTGRSICSDRDFRKTLAGRILDISSMEFSSVCFELRLEGQLRFLRGTPYPGETSEG